MIIYNMCGEIKKYFYKNNKILRTRTFLFFILSSNFFQNIDVHERYKHNIYINYTRHTAKLFLKQCVKLYIYTFINTTKSKKYNIDSCYMKH